MVEFLQRGIFLLIPLLANKRCVSYSLGESALSRDRGTGFSAMPTIGNSNKTEEMGGRERRSLKDQEARSSPQSRVGAGGRKSEARCLAEKARDQVKSDAHRSKYQYHHRHCTMALLLNVNLG